MEFIFIGIGLIIGGIIAFLLLVHLVNWLLRPRD